jgi:hypothetical protein
MDGQMLDLRNRRQIMDALGMAVDELVQDLYSDAAHGPKMVQEPEITSRLCERLEERLDGQRAGDYVFGVIGLSMPDRGRDSMEKITGADLLLSFSLDGPEGFNKAIFVQSKYDRNVNRNELLDACRRMQHHAGSEGTYVWIYAQDGVRVFSSHQIRRMRGNTFEGLQPRSMVGFTGRILDCYAGTQNWGIPMGPMRDRRRILVERLREVRAQYALDLSVRQRH